jgi:hypothetical protein
MVATIELTTAAMKGVISAAFVSLPIVAAPEAALHRARPEIKLRMKDDVSYGNSRG